MLSKESLILLDKMSRVVRHPIGLRNEKGEKGSPLPPEDFELVRNNFHCFFYKDDGSELNLGQIYRSKQIFQQCLADHPDEMKALVDELSTYQFRRAEIDSETGQLIFLPDDPRGPEMKHKLYEAYLLMREYVDDDRILFT